MDRLATILKTQPDVDWTFVRLLWQSGCPLGTDLCLHRIAPQLLNTAALMGRNRVVR